MKYRALDKSVKLWKQKTSLTRMLAAMSKREDQEARKRRDHKKWPAVSTGGE